MEDFDCLAARAYDLKLKAIINQAYSHTSDQHPCFHESRSSRHGAKVGRYVWDDPKPDGTVPNNWLAVFGGITWEWESRRVTRVIPGGSNNVS